MIRAKNWLLQCIETHDKCQSIFSASKGRFVPTRLLEIGEPTSQTVYLRYHPYQRNSNNQYATLSHCWGNSEVLRLNSRTLDRLRKGTEISELAQTFQDAISTARALGIDFTWIDSLCISQDFREDWQRESALMDQVYRHSTLSIAASIAIDSRAGCLPPRIPSKFKPCVVETAWIDHKNNIYHLDHDDSI